MQFLICEENSAEDNSSTAQDDLSLCVDDVQSALRAGVSIQVRFFEKNAKTAKIDNFYLADFQAK